MKNLIVVIIVLMSVPAFAGAILSNGQPAGGVEAVSDEDILSVRNALMDEIVSVIEGELPDTIDFTKLEDLLETVATSSGYAEVLMVAAKEGAEFFRYTLDRLPVYELKNLRDAALEL